MENTYTYTARSATNPEEVVTFTLHDRGLSVEPGVPMEQIERLIQEPDQEGNGKERTPTTRNLAWLKPVSASLLQRSTDPFELADVDVRTREAGFRLTAWLRAGGLRLAPFVFAMPEVDSPGGAQAFAKELKARKAAALPAARLPGPLDYWATWALVALSSLAAAAIWGRRRATASRNDG